MKNTNTRTRQSQATIRRKKRNRKLRIDRLIMAVIALVALVFITGSLFVKSLYAIGILKTPFEERFTEVTVTLQPGETAYDVQTTLVPSMSSDDLHELEWHFEKKNDVASWGNLQPGTYTFFERIGE